MTSHDAPVPSAREQRWEARFVVPTLVAALLVIPTIVIEESALGGAWQVAAAVLNWFIWTVFLAHVVTMLIVTDHRKHWLRKHPLELLLVVLTPPFLPASLQSARILRLLRLFRVALTAQSLRSYFSVAGLKYATLIALFGVLGAGALFATVESEQHMSTWDGVWWSINEVSTTGSEYYPHTTSGRIVAIALLLVGVGYVAILTGAIAQLFVRTMHAEVDATSSVSNKIDVLSADLAALREELRDAQQRT